MAHESSGATIPDTRRQKQNLARFFTEQRQVAWVCLGVAVLWGLYGLMKMPQRKDLVIDQLSIGEGQIQAVVGPYRTGETLVFFDEGKALDSGETSAQAIVVPAGATELKATLVWTDPPGDGLQSDLDLIVKAGAVERHGNVSAASSLFDRTNNVEQVAWTSVPVGPVTVTVSAHRVTLGKQNFALVVRVA